ncbi:MAG: autotransporter-associated beta strand repeat-containing protein, partial [Akkermansiaceae bacterium]|nr:autotransporter-associated beta strand repeat-containing protein [Akkermansiaceae bacterium]
MKLRRPFLPLLAICISFTGSTPAATDQYWNPGGSGGDGIWGTGPGDKNWNLTAGAPAGNTTWLDAGDETANFQTTVGGTVTVFDTVTTSGIALDGAAYTLNAGVITLVPDTAATTPFVNVQTGTLTVDSELAGTSGLRKTGGGNLLLSGSNTYSGLTAVTAGTLNLTGSLAGTTVEISAGASMLDSSGGLANTAALTNSGILTINAPDTIASLTNNAGTVNGTATLTVTGATVFNGGTLAAPLTLNGTGGGTFANATLAGTFNGTAALDGATVSGTLNGNTTSIGNTLVSGSLGGGS